MPITSQIAALVKQFEKENPDSKKAILSKGGGERTVEDQLEIILQLKRKNNYLNIKKRFLTKFSLKLLPEYKDLKPEEKKWWVAEIKKQAGKPNGFAHVGGKAQDVSIKSLEKDDRSRLKEVFEKSGFGVLCENVTNGMSDYKASIDKATVFHVYKK